MSKTYINAFQVFQKVKPDGDTLTYVRPNLHPKYGVKAIKIQLNDDSVVEIGHSDTLFANEVTEERKQKIMAGIQRALEGGYIDQEKSEKRIDQMNKLAFDLTLTKTNEG